MTEADRLDRLVTLLDAGCSPGGWFQPHRLVMLETDPSDPKALVLGQRVLPEGDHPLDHLLGFTAPPNWLGLGVICFGWATSEAGDRPRARAAHQSGGTRARAAHQSGATRARVVTLVERAGNVAATTALDDGTVSDEPAEGTISDALHRCLGLPTPPPTASSGEFFAVMWLHALLSAPRGISWADAAARHPASAWLRSLGRRPGRDDL
ncbi:MAG: hypothetical protein M3P34_05900, partial [Actinomycetota bacterium]|nr:hypothetical protein [Actinomycetota bacterium]